MGRGGGGGGHRSGGGHFNYGGSRGGYSRGGSSSSRRSSSSYTRSVHHYYRPASPVATTLILIIALVMVVLGMLSQRSSIQTSTIERTKLESSQCQKVDTWYQDDIDWIHDEKTLLKGLKDFYNQTGVQPYLWITDNINGKAKPTTSDFESALQAKYDELFNDEGHLIVCFMESSPSIYATYYWAGSAAKGVIDDEAGEILLDVIDSKYTSDLTDEQMFSKSFSDAATRMMKVGHTTKQLVIMTAIAILVVVGVIAVIFLIKAKRKAAAEEAAETERILNTDIDEMSNSVLDKYDN